VKEESALYLEKARWHLASAGTIAAAKPHRGVHGEFSRLAPIRQPGQSAPAFDT